MAPLDRHPLRASPATVVNALCAQSRMRKLFEAAIVAGGALIEVRRALGVSRDVLEQRLSLLRRHGVARTVALFDPRAAGRPVQSVALVRLGHHALGAMVEFEAACIADPAITTAVRLCGAHDYRLTVHHADARQATAWARLMRDRPEVAALDQRFVRILFGHQLAGLPLADGGRDPSGETPPPAWGRPRRPAAS